MCWIGKNCPKIAESDITVYKVGYRYYSNYDKFQSLIFRHDYFCDKLYRELISPITTKYDKYYNTVIVEEGFHSYDSLENLKLSMAMSTLRHLSRIGIAEFEIPKNTKYYINNEGLIVSEQIIFRKWTKEI